MYMPLEISRKAQNKLEFSTYVYGLIDGIHLIRT